MKRALLLALLAVSCGDTAAGPARPVTTLDPPPGPFNDKVVVTLTTDRPATIYATTDGPDSRVESPGRKQGDSKLEIELTATTTLAFHARTPAGAEEAVRTVQYVRAGGAKGSASGVIVVDTVALGKRIQLLSDRDAYAFDPLSAKGEIPFTVQNLAAGPHRLRALADTDGDGSFLPFLDDMSEAFDFEIDPEDPFKASVEGVRLHLGASPAGRCTLSGKITVAKPAEGQLLRMSALSPTALQGLQDPTALLAQLEAGDQILVRPPQTDYPYAITGLEPGRYMPMPLLTSIGPGGLGLNLIASPVRSTMCPAGGVGKTDFTFGPVGLSGTLRVHPAQPAQGLAWGIVAAKTVSIMTMEMQVVLMPVLFLGSEADGTLTATFAGRGLRDHSTFTLRAFTSADGGQPLQTALMWAINPLSSDPPHATVATQADDVVQDIDVPAPTP